jgi:L-alanine-DL-glutamate epimerase-like enolase superfamily enzyme
MKIIKTAIYKFSIPMHPFTIATGTMDFAQNVFIRIYTDDGYYGAGECSAFPMIVGETQATCFEMAKDLAALWQGKNPLAIEERMEELHDYAAFNSTIKSAFDMALFDIAAKNADLPLYKFLGGNKKEIETDLTIGIDAPDNMAERATRFKEKGVRIIKIKLGKHGEEDIERIKQIRLAVGNNMLLRVDANQGWSFDTALFVLNEIAKYNIQFCEQPMRYWNDYKLPELKKLSPVKIMADESVFDHHDAERLIEAGACDYVNIKFSKSAGILEAKKINEACEKNQIACMMGGMLESRVALTAFAHFATTHDNVIFYDMDTCLLGHKLDPVKGGVTFNGYFLNIPDTPGIGADADDEFLRGLEQVIIQ